MQDTTSLDLAGRRSKNPNRLGLLIVAITIAHAVLFFAPEIYFPFDMKELFLLGYGLVIVDSGLATFIGIKLMRRSLFPTKEPK